MNAFQVSLSIAELTARMRTRLFGGTQPEGPKVVWSRGEKRVLLHLDSLRLRAVDGWLLINLELETQPTGRQRLQFVFFVGQDGEGDGLRAAGTVNAPSLQSAQLAEAWSDDLQRVLWDAVLDGIEASVARVEQQNAGKRLQLQGFSCASNALQVRVLAGEA